MFFRKKRPASPATERIPGSTLHWLPQWQDKMDAHWERTLAETHEPSILKLSEKRYNQVWASHHKKQELKQELEDAEWILNYEAKLVAMKTRVQQGIEKAEAVGHDTTRLERLMRRLDNVHVSLRG